jgi:hypothetical protein
VNFTFQRDGVKGEWRVLVTRNCMICTLGPRIFGRVNQEKSDGQDKWRVQGKGEKYTRCFVERPEENNHLEDLRVQVRIILK